MSDIEVIALQKEIEMLHMAREIDNTTITELRAEIQDRSESNVALVEGMEKLKDVIAAKDAELAQLREEREAMREAAMRYYKATKKLDFRMMTEADEARDRLAAVLQEQTK